MSRQALRSRSHVAGPSIRRSSLVFLDDNNSVKLGDFGLSKALPQASFANTYVGVRAIIFLPLSNLDMNLAASDAILHVPGTDARKSLRLKIGHLVPRMSYIRTLRPQTPISRGEDPRRAEHIYKVRSFRCASQYGTNRVLETDAYHLYREVTAKHYRASLKQ